METKSEETEEQSVFFSSNSEINLQKITNINSKNIYQIDLGDCLRYISPTNNITYIGMIHNTKFNIFNLNEDGTFSDDFKTKFEFIDKRSLDILINDEQTSKQMDFLMLKHFLSLFNAMDNFLYIRYLPECFPELKNLDMAKSVIDDLNIELNKTCPDFKINIDYVLNLKDPSLVTSYEEPNPSSLLLCLFNNNNCVSSLSIKFYESNNMTISSRTSKYYEGRKFNKLLRAVLLIIAKEINKKCQIINSYAINPISAFVMIKRLNAEFKGRILLNKNSSFEDIKTFMDSNPDEGLLTKTELNAENIQNATAVFFETIREINCGPLVDDIKAGGKIKTKKGKSKNFKKRKSKQRKSKQRKSKRRKSKRINN